MNTGLVWIGIVATLLVQIIGIGVLILRSGTFIGECRQMFKTLFNEVAAIKTTHLSHASEDDDRHSKVEGDKKDFKGNAAKIISAL